MAIRFKTSARALNAGAGHHDTRRYGLKAMAFNSGNLTPFFFRKIWKGGGFNYRPLGGVMANDPINGHRPLDPIEFGRMLGQMGDTRDAVQAQLITLQEAMALVEARTVDLQSTNAALQQHIDEC